MPLTRETRTTRSGIVYEIWVPAKAPAADADADAEPVKARRGARDKARRSASDKTSG